MSDAGDDQLRKTLLDRRAFWDAERLARILVAHDVVSLEDAMVRAVEAVRWPDEEPPTPVSLRL